MFEEYKDLYDLTKKTVDEHIEFFKKKETIPTKDLFSIWKKLSDQTENFDKRKWTENWHNWDKNMQGFKGHKMEAQFLIQNYLTDVLEEIIRRIMEIFGKYIDTTEERKKTQLDDSQLSSLIRSEIKRQVKEELANKKPKKRRK